MRIAFFAWESLHSIAVGGLARHVTELAAALERRGHEIHVYCRPGEEQQVHEVIDGVHYHRCPIELKDDMCDEVNGMCNRFMCFMRQTEAYMNAPFDIVHAHDWLCAKGLVQAKRDDGRRCVLTLHSTEYGRCGNNSHNGESERICAIEGEAAHCADRVITVSGHLADEVKWLYNVHDGKLRMIHNGINCHRYDGYIDPAVCRRTYGIGPMDPMVLYVGRMSTQKGPDLLLNALPHVLHMRSDTKAVFVGDGDMRAALEWRAGELGVSHAVRFVGAMGPDSDVINLFKSTDVVCIPSRNEPFGIVVLEAWAAGKPIVVTRNGGPPSFVSHNEDGYVVYDNWDSIRWGISQIFNNFAHAQWMGERGRVKAAYGFSWDRIAGETESVYQELM